jgi:hypothetical protein
MLLKYAAKVYSNLWPTVGSRSRKAPRAPTKDLWKKRPRFIKLVYVACSVSKLESQ